MKDTEDQEPKDEPKEEPRERSRPSTPSMTEWWRPNYPPQTYKWEEIRRQRERGGYPWTLLDRPDRDFDLDDNLYEPVNPPPLYGSGYNMRFASDTASLDGRVIDIPPEIDIITSEGLDGLDQPDFHDIGFDGEREWYHSDEDHGSSAPKTGFTAGIRNRDMPKSGETSSIRPLVGKSITFAEGTEQKPGDQEVPVTPEPGASKPSALDQLKEKAGRVKQRISKISLPVRPKFNNWTGIRLSKKKRKTGDDGQPEGDEPEIPEDVPKEPVVHKPPRPKPGRKEPLTIPTEVTQASTTKIIEQPLTAPAIPLRPAEVSPADIAQQDEAKKLKEQEADKIAKEKEAGRLAKEQEAARIAKEKELAKIVKEDEATKLASQKDKAKILKEEELARIASEKDKAKIAKEEEDARIAKEKELAKLIKAEEAARIAKEKGLQGESESAAALEEQDAAVRAIEEELELRLKSHELENKRIKEEEKLAKQATQEELKKIKAEEKAVKDKIKEEQKKVKMEEKAIADQQAAEIRRARVVEELKLEIELANREETGETPDEQLERRLAAIVDEFEQDLGPPSQHSREPSASPTPKKPSAGEVIKRKLADIDFTKRFKISKTPPPRPEPPKIRFSRRDKSDLETKNLGTQYAYEIQERKAEMDSERLHEPQIYVTQPSMEAESETHSDWIPPSERASEPEWPQEGIDAEEGSERPPEKRKLGRKLKGIGQGIGQGVKVIGHNLKKFGKDAVKEVKDTQERKRNREAQQAEQEDGENLPRRRFRFKRRGNGQQEVDDVQRYQPVVVESIKKPKKRGVKQPTAYYENNEEIREQFQQVGQTNGTSKVQRNQVIGQGERDWESLLDDTHSREVSEEPNFSGNMSSGRDSPLGSSRASSSVHQGRRQGVMEEIDSDEFFLRERGISEGEDEELLNRILVEELRQTFRPTMSNTLNDFDLPTPPAKPSRTPRKPPRQEKEKNGNAGKKSPNFQTFPPERPKRKQTPKYISSYMESAENQEGWDNEEKISQEIEPETFNESEDEDEGIRRVKNELRKIDQDMEDEERYEPVSDSPQRPQRAKRKKEAKTPEPPQILYYNTIAGNEWLKELEDQITAELDLTLVDDTPVPPKRDRRKSEGKSETHSQLQGTSEIDDSELQFADEEDVHEPEGPKRGYGEAPPLAQAESVGQMDDGDSLDYMDEAGYTIVQKNKESPKTVPRKRSKGSLGGSSPKKNSLKRRTNQQGQAPTGGSGPIFFSLPRYTPRTFHIVPPTRPHRTYSTLRPKRPPRHKSMSSHDLEKKSSSSIRKNGEGPSTPSRPEETDRPNTAIGIMQGRPLPPPPRPTRSPAPMNDLDQVSIERMVGVRHYANFEDRGDDAGYPVAVEEPCVSRNISMLGRDEGEAQDEDSILANSEINVAIQTDPVPDEDYELNTLGSFEDEDGRIDKARYSLPGTSSDEQHQSVRDRPERQPAVPVPSGRSRSPIPTQTQVIFPSRLHLDELEVDFLRVNELTAHSLTMDQLHSPHLQVNSLTSSGPLLVQSIQSPALTVNNISSQRIATGDVELPSDSLPPPQFYRLASPTSAPAQIRSGGSGEQIDDTFEAQRAASLDTQETLKDDDECCPPGVALTGGEGQQRPLVTPQRSVQSTSPSRISGGPSSSDPENDDLLELTIRLGRGIFRLMIRTLGAITDYIDTATSNDPECQQQQRAHMQALICMLLILVAGIFLMTRSGSSQPRWEYYLPPPVE